MPTLEELAKVSDLLTSFYVQLVHGGIPPELAALLTRDYFNHWLRQGDKSITPLPSFDEFLATRDK